MKKKTLEEDCKKLEEDCKKLGEMNKFNWKAIGGGALIFGITMMGGLEK